MDSLYDAGTIAAIRALKEDVSALSNLMALDTQGAMDAWRAAVDKRLLPRLQPEFPLVAVICGGGSSGKSTLFNTLAGQVLSPTGGRAGINRRILVALSDCHRDTPAVAEALFEPFGCPPQPLTAMDQLTRPGDPLLVYTHDLPAALALVDTPDFDTGAMGNYQNRELVEGALQAADVLVYIFTNANYNNRDNTDFIARMLTSVGTRNCLLVYRADSGFTDREIREHADTVGKNIYGGHFAPHVCGIYRAVEDNRVAGGLKPMSILPVAGDLPGLMDALKQMDPRQVRGELHRSIFEAVIEQGQGFLRVTQDANRHLELYLEGLRRVQRRCVQDALGRLPMDAVVRRFSEIWQATDPSHIKIMRRTGQVVETPVRLLMRVAKWIGRGARPKNRQPSDGDVGAAMETDLVQAAGRLRQAVMDPVIELRLSAADPAAGALRDAARQLPDAVGIRQRRGQAGDLTIEIPLPPALVGTQEALRGENWSAVVDDMLARQESLLSLTHQLETELQRLAGEQRVHMTTTDQIRQTFSAMLNIIPATAAVTYVLHTGDPVGAVGIKVKLAGLFGLNDLYALVAIPATAGMKKADLKQLESLLGPVAQAWLTHKLTAIEALFETTITGALLEKGRGTVATIEARVASMSQSLGRCHRIESRPRRPAMT